MKHLATPLALLLAGCSGNITGDGGGDPARDITPPTVEIESPARGTMADGSAITVTGRVTDSESAIAEVRINGEVATLSGDSFTLELSGTAGINLVETSATDAAGNQAFDNRAVLIGTLVDQATPVADGLVARLDGSAMDGLGAMVSDLAGNTNFTALAVALNPVVNTGDGCNSAKIFVDSIAHGAVPVEVAPTAGGIATDVSIASPVVRGHVNFRALCLGGSATFTITATSFDVAGRIRPTLSGGDIAVGLDGVTSGFAGFNLSVDGVPQFIVDLFEGAAKDKITAVLRDKIKAMVPQMATSFLGDFLQDAYSVAALGQTIDIAIKPTSMTWDAAGGRIALETRATVAGVEGASYLSTPMPAPEAMSGSGLSVALADDLANQLLAGMWAAGALEIEMVPGEGDPIRAFFDQADRLKLSLSLPPVVNADTTTGNLELAVGDIIVEVLDDDQGVGTIARFAVSSRINLSAALGADGRLQIETGEPRTVGQVLEQDPNAVIQLDNAKVAAFADLAIKQFADKADGLLGTLPIPGVPGAELSAPTVSPSAGYVLLGGTLSVP